jgi:response regulator RpfG family c-di-GMP phosphodiesterase
MITNKILFVDDDPNILSAYKRMFHKRFDIVTSSSGDEGLTRLSNDGPFAVVVADMQMPGMNGVQFLGKAQEQSPETVRLMLTGNADQKTAADAVNQGRVFSFLTKPCQPTSLEEALVNALKQYRLVVAERELLEQTLNGAIKVLTEVLSITDPASFGRAQQLREEVKMIARWFRAPRPWELELGAMLSQVGYVAIPPALVAKARSGAQLSGTETDMLTRFPEMGASLLEKIPRLEAVAEIVRYQKKNFDGTGFPVDGVAGEAIPIGARILRVLNDLLDRESRQRSRADVLHGLRQTSGRYDPKVLEAIAACFDVYLAAPEPDQNGVLPTHVSDLRAGAILAEDVLTRDGTLVVVAETMISDALLQKLRNFHEVMGLKEPLFVKNQRHG